MITLRKLSYIVGLIIAITVFALFLYSFLPQMLYHNAWDNRSYNEKLDITKEEVLEKFKAGSTYIAFYKKYPNATEEFNYTEKSAELEVGVANFDTNSYLKLHFNLHPYDDRVRVNAYCQTDDPYMEGIQNRHADGMFVEEFIKVSECIK